MSHIHAEVRCSVVVFSGDRVLLVRRRDKDDWALPGGTPRPGEGLPACARREVREETGMLIEPGPCVFIVETVRPYAERMLDLVFLANGQPAGQPRVSEEGLGPQLVPLGEIGALRLHPPVARDLESLHRRGGSTPPSRYLRYDFGAAEVTTR